MSRYPLQTLPVAVLVCFISVFVGAEKKHEAPSSWSARVVGVTDGDSVTVLRDRHEQVKIRLYGIDAPERGQPFGTKSRQHLAGLVFGKEVRIIPRDTDRYGRTVGQIEVAGRDVSTDMIRAGLAWWLDRYAPKDDALRSAERSAREAKVGLWSDPAPVAPWEWRKAARAVE
jgi:endonuclease YncB( thermonuclease family)